MPNTEEEENSSNSSAVSIQHVSIKPPQFSEQNASGWFAILEAQFQLGRLTSSSNKFFQCLSAMPPSLVTRLPPGVLEGHDYEELKAAVLGLVESSKPEIFESLLRTEQLVGRPSACLSVIQRAAEKVGVGNDFVRHKFLNSLPPTITPVLAAQSTLSLAQLGTLADELVSFADSRPTQCSHVSRSSTQQPTQSTQQLVHAAARPFHPNQRPKVCRAHIYYGDEARTCRSWCTWPNKHSCSIQPNTRPNSPVPARRHHHHRNSNNHNNAASSNEQGTC